MKDLVDHRMRDGIIDISVPLTESTHVWPGSVGLRIKRVMQIEEGCQANVTQLDCDVHVGTHVETELHFLKNGRSIDQISLSLLIGPALVVHLDSHGPITAKALEHENIPAGTVRLLLRTTNSGLWKDKTKSFCENYVGLTADGARWIVERGIQLVGTDYLSVANFSEIRETHITLMEARVLILEGLNLQDVEPGRYELICLPMKLEGAEAAPARAILRRSL